MLLSLVIICTGKKAKELVYSGVHDWNHVWTKYLKKSDDDDGVKSWHDEWTGYSEHVLPYEWSKWPIDDAVESHRSGILFYWKLKKLL